MPASKNVSSPAPRPRLLRPGVIKRRFVAVILTYSLLTAAVLAVLLLNLRADAVTTGEKVLAGYAELANVQTATTLQNIERALEEAEEMVTSRYLSHTRGTQRSMVAPPTNATSVIAPKTGTNEPSVRSSGILGRAGFRLLA